MLRCVRPVYWHAQRGWAGTMRPYLLRVHGWHRRSYSTLLSASTTCTTSRIMQKFRRRALKRQNQNLVPI
jgi:hypothetical protein